MDSNYSNIQVQDENIRESAKSAAIGVPQRVNSTIDPTVNDDVNAGYLVGCVWNNTTTEKSFTCFDNSAGAASWVASTGVVGAYVHQGAYDANTNTPDLDVSPSGISKGYAYTVTVDGNFFTEAVEVGDLLIADIDNPTTLGDWTRVNKNIDQATETTPGIAEIATQVETDAETDDQRYITPLKLGTWFSSKSVGLTSLNGETGSSQTFAVGTSGSDFGVSSSSNVHTLNMPDAGATKRGVVNFGTQTFGGDKTFTGDLIADGDFYFAGGTEDTKVTFRNNVVFGFEKQTPGKNFSVEYYTKDGDGTDSLQFNMYGVGTSVSVTNRERMIMEYSSSDISYRIWTEANGTGILRPLILFTEGNTDQLKLDTDGTVSIGQMLKLSSSTSPTIDDTGDFALDTSITDFSFGLLKYYASQENVVVAMRASDIASPTHGYVVTYNGTTDRFELAASTGAPDQNLWATINADTGSTTANTTTDTLTVSGGEAIDTSISGDTLTIAAEDASTSNKGVSEFATSSETTTGTDATRSITPDGLAGSDFGKRNVTIVLQDDTQDNAIGDGAGDLTWTVPEILDGYNIVDAQASVEAAGTTGTLDIQIHNVTDAVDILSTKITIDSGELTSYNAATPPVINGANDDLDTGDKIRFDVDAIHTGTAAKGLQVILTLQLP